MAFGKITEKVGKKGQEGPLRIPDVETIRCPKASTREVTVNHRLVNMLSGKTICTYCQVDWVTLDERVRKQVKTARTAKQVAAP